MRRLSKLFTPAVLALLGTLALAGPARAEVSAETQFVFNTFSFLVHGFLVMWMAAGFSMLEAGLVRSKNVATISGNPGAAFTRLPARPGMRRSPSPTRRAASR